MDLQIKNKNALITGGSRGLGKAAALHLAQEGVNVSICGRSSEDLASTAKEIENGVNVYHIDTFFEGTAKKFLTELLAAMKGEKWYDNTDSMIDYFDTAWYNDIKIGEWNKPVEIV